MLTYMLTYAQVLLRHPADSVRGSAKQLLHDLALAASSPSPPPPAASDSRYSLYFTCFTSTEVQLLTHLLLRCAASQTVLLRRRYALSLLVLLVQEYKY